MYVRISSYTDFWDSFLNFCQDSVALIWRRRCEIPANFSRIITIHSKCGSYVVYINKACTYQSVMCDIHLVQTKYIVGEQSAIEIFIVMFYLTCIMNRTLHLFSAWNLHVSWHHPVLLLSWMYSRKEWHLHHCWQGFSDFSINLWPILEPCKT